MAHYLVSWKIGGEAGFGIKSAGLMFAKVVNRAGYEAFGYTEYPSLIRGGHNTYQVTVAETPVKCAARGVDILVALNAEAIKQHAAELNEGGVIIFDRDTVKTTGAFFKETGGVRPLHVPFKAITEKANGSAVMRNTVALGASQAIVGLPFSLLASVIKKNLGHKSHLLAANLNAARLGYEYVKKEYKHFVFKTPLSVRSAKEELLLSGNDALSLGALAAGLQFYAAYPMTPSSTILHYLASQAASQRLVVKHAEDEISVVNMAIGASHAGARTMIGTSGGGFSLMVEGMGLAGITETPLVIVEAQRPGPATGLPTWTEQADLRFVMHAAQGEFPRIVLAPGDHEECFSMTAAAFNMADRYQTPVIILTDKFLGESDRTVLPFNHRAVKIDRGQATMSSAALLRGSQYRRYRVTESGISPRAIPGQRGGLYLANSDEHDERGYTSEESENRIAQVEKRARKLAHAARELGGAHLYGNPRARITVVGWGSTKGPIENAIDWLPDRMRRKVNFLHINVLMPFPSRRVADVLRRSRKVLLVENNSTAQLGGIIREYTGRVIHDTLLRFDGRPVFPREIKERIMAL